MVGSKLGQRHHLGDVVLELDPAYIPQASLARDLGDGKAGGLGRQRRGSADTRGFISMMTRCGHRPGFGLPLHGSKSARSPPRSRAAPRSLAEHMLLGYSLLGRGLSAGAMVMRIAGMHAHGVDILDRADDDGNCRPCRVPPPSRIPFQPQHHRIPRSALRWWGWLPARLDDGEEEFLAVVGDAAAGAPPMVKLGRITGGPTDLVQDTRGPGQPVSGRQLHQQGIVVAVADGIAAGIAFSAAAGPSGWPPLGASRPMASMACLEATRGPRPCRGSSVGGGADQFDVVALQWRRSCAADSAVFSAVCPAHGGQQGKEPCRPAHWGARGR